MRNTREIQKKIQDEAVNKYENLSIKRGSIVAGTGVGKTLCAIRIADKYKKSLFVEPTEDLRDKGIKDEYDKWGFDYSKIDTVCYASLNKVDLSKYDLIVLDEAHHLSPNNSKNFRFYKGHILGLTATPPIDYDKKQLFDRYLPIVFYYPLEKAIEDGVVSPYTLTIVRVPLSTTKDLLVKTKTSKFFTSEKDSYDSLTRKLAKEFEITGRYPDRLMFFRNRFLYNLKSKERAANKLLENELSDSRTIIFTGSKKQANSMCKNRYYSGISSKALEDFNNLKIDKLSCVDKINEGVNITEVESLIMLKTVKNPLTTVQRIGRSIRWRKDHIATIYIMCAKDTVEEDWIYSATSELNNIKYINL